MKNDDAPKVAVIPVSNNNASEFSRIGEFNGMGELILHTAKFRSSNLVPRIVLCFRYQTRPRSFNGTVCPIASLHLRFPSKLRRSQRRILFLNHRLCRNCRRTSSEYVFDTDMKWNRHASQNEDAETHLREHGGRRGSLVTVRFDGQAVSPGSPSTAERGPSVCRPHCFLDRVTTTTCRCWHKRW